MQALRKPNWLKVQAPGGDRYVALKKRMRALQLNTVCEEARCPNIGECWSSGTATVMILGEICTRGCRFCAVQSGQPPLLDREEPGRVSEAIREMALDYVVITSVDRDDLSDGGSTIFSQTITAVQQQAPNTLTTNTLRILRHYLSTYDILRKHLPTKYVAGTGSGA